MLPDLSQLLDESYSRAMDEIGCSQVLFHGPANRQCGWEAVGGWLALTSSELVFASHRVNIQNGVLHLPLSSLYWAKPCWTWLFGILPVVANGLLIQERSGHEHRFVVANRQQWADAIRAVL
jgi:hypothetical protein